MDFKAFSEIPLKFSVQSSVSITQCSVWKISLFAKKYNFNVMESRILVL